jgi:cytoskeletal protein CcmA (bactofilin family)
MFGKEVETNVQEGRLNSILGKGCKFKGTVDVEGTLRIDAEFEGVVNCPDTLVVGKTGVVKAEINVKNAVIGGKVIGNINATNKIELQSGSHIEGDIHTHRLVIDEGVFFEGSCKMGVTTEEAKPHLRRPGRVERRSGRRRPEAATAAESRKSRRLIPTAIPPAWWRAGPLRVPPGGPAASSGRRGTAHMRCPFVCSPVRALWIKPAKQWITLKQL